jgi:hypothetical protein
LPRGRKHTVFALSRQIQRICALGILPLAKTLEGYDILPLAKIGTDDASVAYITRGGAAR